MLGGGNNAKGVLYETIITTTQTTCKVADGHSFGDCEFPFRMTIFNEVSGALSNIEIVEVSTITSDTGFDIFTITRAKESTTAQTHSLGKTCENRITYGYIKGINTQLAATDQTVTDNKTEVTTHLAESAAKHITESGSNANGEYIKFDDGTMICHTRGFRMNYFASNRLSDSYTFPATFIAIPSVLVSLDSTTTTTSVAATDIGSFQVFGLSTTSAQYIHMWLNTGVANTYIAGDYIDVAVVIVGRWKL